MARIFLSEVRLQAMKSCLEGRILSIFFDDSLKEEQVALDGIPKMDDDLTLHMIF
ncbi:hypothetical protein [Kriegella aquimaris]|uniref:hypothetical protein n=1 Tax=Kriegella aquimaris TaxID=192904 RepID=UPI0015A2923E|nr:hypothetical protein [Kriegella aquimaris]